MAIINKVKLPNNTSYDVLGHMQSNRNLLDNPFFTVNQRNAISVTGVRTKAYGVDRWYCYNSTMSVKDGCIEISGSGQNFSQKVDERVQKSIIGKEVTFSVIGKGAYAIIVEDALNSYHTEYNNSSDYKLTTVTLTVGSSSDRLLVHIQPSSTNPCYIKCAKLEHGSVSTLANDIAPDYLDELFHCSTSTADPDDGFANKAYNLNASNRNYLDNPFFTINQRGATAASGWWTYGVDRWSTREGGYLVTDSGLKHDTSKGVSVVFQTIIEEDIVQLDDRRVTFSAKIDNVIYSKTLRLSSNSTSFVTFLPVQDKAEFSYIFVPSTKRWYFVCTLINQVTLNAVKLELGTVSTLEHDTQPDYQTELAKCQRYFIRLNTSGGYQLFSGVAVSTTIVRAAVMLPTVMRAFPSLSISNIAKNFAKGNGSSLIPTAYALVATDGRNTTPLLSINFTVTGATTNRVYEISSDTSTTIDFSAEL